VANTQGLLAVLCAPHNCGHSLGEGEVMWIHAALRCTAEAGHTYSKHTSAKADAIMIARCVEAPNL